jgi:holin-like protein
MQGFAILLGFQLLGLALQRAGVPMPAPVLGMLLFTLSLFAGWIKLEWVEQPAGLLLRNMLLFFVPVTVAVMGLAPELARQWLPIAGSLVVSFVAVILTTGLISHLLLPKGAVSSDVD